MVERPEETNALIRAPSSLESTSAERNVVRRLFGVLLLGSSLVLLVAAAAAGRVPTPSPDPDAGRRPPRRSAADAATVLIYPFDVQTGVDAKIGIAIASILAQEMAAAGGLNVWPVPQGVKRADFLQNARTKAADFYISGYVTPVGDAAAVVEQVVSVDSGVILFSQTAQVQSVADVASQSLLARAQILAFVNRATQNIAAAIDEHARADVHQRRQHADPRHRAASSIRFSTAKAPRRRRRLPAVKPDRGIIVAPVNRSGVPAPAPTSPTPPTNSSSRCSATITCR